MGDTPPMWVLTLMWAVTVVATISWLTVAAFDYNLLTDPIGLSGDARNLVYIVVGTIGLIDVAINVKMATDSL